MLRRLGPAAEALVESALEDVKVLEDLDFHDIVISVKASEVPMAIDAYTLISARVRYPLHVGITESGTLGPGSVKSATGIGAILALGRGDGRRRERPRRGAPGRPGHRLRPGDGAALPRGADRGQPAGGPAGGCADGACGRGGPGGGGRGPDEGASRR